jgi:hypothetical protein
MLNPLTAPDDFLKFPVSSVVDIKEVSLLLFLFSKGLYF